MRFRGITCNPILAPIWTQEYKWGESIEDFKPELIGSSPRILIQLRLFDDENNKSSASFSADEKDLTLIMNEFKSALIKIDQLKKGVPGV